MHTTDHSAPGGAEVQRVGLPARKWGSAQHLVTRATCGSRLAMESSTRSIIPALTKRAHATWDFSSRMERLFFEEKRNCDSKIQWLADGVQAFRWEHRREGRYRIEKLIVSDPQRDTVLQDIHFIARKAIYPATICMSF